MKTDQQEDCMEEMESFSFAFHCDFLYYVCMYVCMYIYIYMLRLVYPQETDTEYWYLKNYRRRRSHSRL